MTDKIVCKRSKAMEDKDLRELDEDLLLDGRMDAMLEQHFEEIDSRRHSNLDLRASSGLVSRLSEMASEAEQAAEKRVARRTLWGNVAMISGGVVALVALLVWVIGRSDLAFNFGGYFTRLFSEFEFDLGVDLSFDFSVDLSGMRVAIFAAVPLLLFLIIQLIISRKLEKL